MTTLDQQLGSGLFVRADFVPMTLCTAVCEEMRRAPSSAGTVLDGEDPLVDERTRRARKVTVARPARDEIASRLHALTPVVADHFGCALAGLRELQFLAYDRGDFFIFHRDRTDASTEPARVRARKVSVVIFLNEVSDHPVPGSYSGGALQFYAPDLVADADYEKTKLSLTATAGTLIAFDPRVRHQVQPVTSGRRYTVVTWFV